MAYSLDIDLDLKDILAILFRRKKTCPDCGEKVKRQTANVDEGMGWDKSIIGFSFKAVYVQKYTTRMMYFCSSCSKYYKPSVFW